MNAFRTALRFARRHAPEILSALSAAGTIGTGVLSARMMTRKNEDGKIPIVEILPPAACAATTIGCIFGSNAVSRKRQASLAAAYMLVSRGLAEIRDSTGVKVVESEQTLPAKRDPTKKIFYLADGFEFFESTDEDVLKAQYAANHLLSDNGMLTLNELRTLLLQKESISGDQIGWDVGNMLDNYGTAWLDFMPPYEQEMFEEDGSAIVVTVIETIIPPEPFDYEV